MTNYVLLKDSIQEKLKHNQHVIRNTKNHVDNITGNTKKEKYLRFFNRNTTGCTTKFVTVQYLHFYSMVFELYNI